MVNLTYSAFEVIIIIFGLFSIIPVYRSWKESKNRIYIAISALTVGVMMYSMLNLITYMLEIDTAVNIIGGLKFGYILGYILATIQFEFMLYLKGLTKLYTLPIIVAFYLIMGNILNSSSMHFILYVAFVGYVPAYLLLREGKKKRNGLAFGMGLLFLLWGIGQAIPVTIVMLTFRTVAIFLFFLGTRGFYEKYIFLDQKEEQKIMGTWIAKFVVKD